MKRVLRYRIKVDGGPQVFRTEADSDALRVEAVPLDLAEDGGHYVDFWMISFGQETEHTYEVFGTGHPIPDNALWQGTTARTSDGLVWHLFQLNPWDRQQ